MSEKSNKYSLVVAAINASFTILLIIFVAHQQIEIANLKEMVKENTRNKADKLETTSSSINQERMKAEEAQVFLNVGNYYIHHHVSRHLSRNKMNVLYIQENSTETDSYENEEINKPQYITRETRDASSRCCGTSHGQVFQCGVDCIAL